MSCIILAIITMITLADWAISSTSAAVFLAVLCAILLACSLTLLKLYCVEKNGPFTSMHILLLGSLVPRPTTRFQRTVFTCAGYN